MSKHVPILGLLVLLSIVGCGVANGAESPSDPGPSKGDAQTSTCGAREGFEFKLHKVDCEIANALIVCSTVERSISP